MAVVSFEKRYNVQCQHCDCDFDFEGAHSREAAHELAANHIHEEDRNGYRPNEEHEVEITEIEIAGTNI